MFWLLYVPFFAVGVATSVVWGVWAVAAFIAAHFVFALIFGAASTERRRY